MDKVVYDRIDDVLGRIESLYGRVEDTYLVAKDILLGTQISDWIADLKASGTASATYSDASRMNVLIANEDAANNVDVAKYLVQWAVANNKYGTYCGAACGAVSGVTWDSLTTPNAVMGNATAFTALCGNSVAFKASMQNSGCKTAIWDNSVLTESIIVANALSFMADFVEDLTNGSHQENIKWFVTSASGMYRQEYDFVYQTKNNGQMSISFTGDYSRSVNKFITAWHADPMSYAVPIAGVDFS